MRERLCCPHDLMGVDEDTGYCSLARMCMPGHYYDQQGVGRPPESNLEQPQGASVPSGALLDHPERSKTCVVLVNGVECGKPVHGVRAGYPMCVSHFELFAPGPETMPESDGAE